MHDEDEFKSDDDFSPREDDFGEDFYDPLDDDSLDDTFSSFNREDEEDEDEFIDDIEKYG